MGTTQETLVHKKLCDHSAIIEGPQDQLDAHLFTAWGLQGGFLRATLGILADYLGTTWAVVGGIFGLRGLLGDSIGNTWKLLGYFFNTTLGQLGD